MKRKSLAGLVVINLALVLVLGVLCLTPQPASGQLGRGRGDYVMIGGRALGQNAGVLYILDIVSERIIAVGYDKTRKMLTAAAGRDVNEDLKGNAK